MSDEGLIARLREGATWDDDIAAADRIEELEAQQAITLTALKQLSTAGCFGNGEALGIDMSKTPLGREILARMEYARATIAKIKGEQP